MFIINLIYKKLNNINKACFIFFLFIWIINKKNIL